MRYLSIIFIGLLLSSCMSTQNRYAEHEIRLFGLGWDTFALVEDGTVIFYNIGNGWERLDERRDFTLPTDYDKVVLFDLVHLGVIADNNLRFFGYTHQTRWREWENRALILPQGYKNVIGLNRHSLGVIVGNTLIYYRYVQPWMERLSREFTLPEGFVSVVGLEPQRFDRSSIGIIVGNKLKHYIFHENAWHKMEDMTFILPENFSSVIGFSWGRIGVVVDNILRYYEFSDFQGRSGWFENQWYEFNLNRF